MKNQPRKWTDLFEFPDPSGLSALEAIEQNLEFYEANVREMESQYGGTFVRDKELHYFLIKMLQLEAALRQGTVNKCVHLETYPAEEFIAVPIVFDVKMPGEVPVQSKRWYFIRRPRVFLGGSIGSRLDFSS